MRVFFNRYSKAIFEKKLVVIIPIRLRKRLWMLLNAHNSNFQIQSDTGYESWTDAFAETKSILRTAYGEEKLEARLQNSSRGPVNTLQEFFDGCYPSQVLDVVEAFLHFQADKDSFTRSVNDMFEDEECPWRLDDGEFFAVDKTFMGIRLTELAEQSLKSKAFHGAYEEFREARQDLLAGDTKGCISNAQKAFESALKTLLGTDNGNASNLIRKFVADGHVDDLPTEFKTSFGEQVLMSVPTMGNRLGRHGQGAAVINVPAAYAQLTLEMAAAYLNFLVKVRPPEQQPTIESTEISDDDIPF